MANISQWSVTAGNNNSAAPNGAPEGMSPSGVNDVIRENMSAGAKVYKDQKGALVSGGTGTAYTLTTNNAHAALGDIGFTVFRVNTISTGAATIAVDGLAAKSLKISGANVTAGDLPQDVLIGIAYNSTTDAFDVFGVGREELEDIAAITHADGKIIVSDGTDWVGESGSTARASLGLAIGTDVQAYDAVLDGTTASFTTADESKLDAIEASADVTDATNVDAAGAVMNSDASTSSMSFVVDEDDMISNLATKVPTQQSTKAYVDATVVAIGALAVAGTPEINDYARFTGAATIEGRSLAEVKTDLGILFNKYDATGAPTANDDGANTSGNGTFVVGSEWVNVSTDLSYKCMDSSTGAAVWAWTNEASEVSYPQNSKSADYTLVIGDAGKQIFHPATDTSLRTFTIPANTSVAYDIGTIVLFVNESGAGNLTIGITSDTLQSLDGTTGSVLVIGGNVVNALKITATKWLLWSENKTASSPFYVAVGHATSPFVSAYPWSSLGFGAKFSNPSTLPTDTGNAVAFSPAGTEIAVGHATSPFVSAYPWSSLGFGAKFSNPSTLPTNTGNAVAFSPAGTEIAVGHAGSPFVSAYPWSSLGFGTKFSNPSTLPTGNGLGVEFSPAGTEIAVGHTTSPFVSAYPWSPSGFGTKFSNPSTLPTGTGNEVAFSPAGTEIVVSHAGSPFVSAYPWTGSAFGTKFSNPSTLPTGTGNGVAFSPAGTEIAVAHTTSPFVSAYPWTGSAFGTKFSNPSTLPAGTGNAVAFSPAGTEIAVGHATSPFVSAYPWSPSGFGTKFSDPSTLPTGGGNGVAFN